MGRSTARAGPSQPTQTQKGRGGRRQQPVEEPSEEEEEQNEEDEQSECAAMDVDADDDDADSDISRKVNALVRLALFTEYKRSYLRRDDISKKVLGSSSRSFNQILELAQKKLRDTFGMELVELSSRAALDKDDDDGKKDTQAATGLKKKAAATKSKNYVLRSILDPILIERAAQTDEDILEEEAADQAVLYPTNLNIDEDEEENLDEEDARIEAGRAPKYYGSIISWSKADQLGSLGILYVILSLVLASGRVISDAKLRQHLRTLRLPSNSGTHPIQHTSTSTTREISLDDYLSTLLKQGYLHRQQVGGDVGGKKGGKKGGGGVKRVRTQAEDQEAGQVYEWLWGARAFAEVGEEFIAKFIAEFMIASEGEVDPDEEDAAEARKKRKETLQKMYAGVEKAAGGKLVELS